MLKIRWVDAAKKFAVHTWTVPVFLPGLQITEGIDVVENLYSYGSVDGMLNKDFLIHCIAILI